MCVIISIVESVFMRNSQAGCDPQGRCGRSRDRVSNSPAIPLAAAFYSAAVGLGQIVSKLVIQNIFSTPGGAFSGAEERFLPALREMPTTNDRQRLAIHRLGRSALEMPDRVEMRLLAVLC